MFSHSCVFSYISTLKTDAFSACQVVLVFHNPPNSGIDYRIFNARISSFCMRMHTGDLGLKLYPKDYVEFAQILTPDDSEVGAKPST